MSQYLDKDGASRIAENFLSKQAEQDAILRNLQFDLKEAEHALVKTIQGPALLNIRALTRPLDDYLISGNTIQNGTPTPDNPVDVVGCGVRTENLFDLSVMAYPYDLDISTGLPVYRPDSIIIRTVTTVPIDVTGLTQVTLTYSSTVTNTLFIYSIFNNDVLIERVANKSSGYTISLNGANKLYLCFYNTYNSVVTDNLSDMMLNTGSASKPYEPYGYKLPLTIGGTEYPIYLGSCQTTRRIRKLVLDGTETWTAYGGGDTLIYTTSLNISGAPDSTAESICTHLEYGDRYTQGQYDIGVSGAMRISAKGFASLSAFKQFLVDEYANGTPVTVWYVLAEPETAVVNEPLHKIGAYADIISFTQAGVEISTTKGFNAITTDTTVSPSNIEVKGVINNA